MLIERRLRLLSPVLAAKRSNDPAAPRRVFVHQKTPKGEPTDKVYLTTDLRRWEWAFLEARDALSLGDVCLAAVMPSHWYSVSHTSTYNQKCRAPGGAWDKKQYESVPAGQVMRIQFTLSRHVPPNTDGVGRFARAPEEQEFDAMLAFIGEHLGMSEYGHALKMGRFEIRPPNNNDERKEGGDSTVDRSRTGSDDVAATT